ncbi:hypothetical protein GCM10011391_39340 [Pullulanibacillus camelliae]|uniref:EAL domain-containing protein n=1 Tax=Pullulanibacillus camelliae TaxID=1707096 RepID=A0A8J3E114_9BACL|nr:EAL domain-containing protein [Pullulanibacillus camelliae]GGE56572.1 hypothetical protein GCM10011391_39340 [Pullulanibacillus camelliae]
MVSLKNFIKEERFFHHYQPIYNLSDHGIEGYEVLFRTEKYTNPEEFFDWAKRKKQLYELDSRSIHKAVLTYQSAGFTEKDGNLFINVFPSTLLHPQFPSFIKHIINEELFSSQHLVFEILESEAIPNYSQLMKVIKLLKELGASLAIDDFGKGYHDFQKIVELDPNYIKLDRYFVKGLLSSEKKQGLLKLLLNFCEEHQCKLIVEGLETQSELSLVRSIGLHYGQGFGLRRPDNIANLVKERERLKTLPPGQMEDRRRFRREKFGSKECKVTFLDFGQPKLQILKNKSVLAQLSDISLGGLKFFCQLDLPVQHKVLVKVQFSHNHEFFELPGRIIRKEAHSKKDLIAYGLEYQSLSKQQEITLCQLINSLELSKVT